MIHKKISEVLAVTCLFDDSYIITEMEEITRK